MKEALVSVSNERAITVSLREVQIPAPSANQVLIKVVVSGCNPKDWKLPMYSDEHQNTNPGDDIAGVIHAVGDEVKEFKAGDRVAAFHEIRAAHGSFAEYAIAPAHTTFHLPAHTTFEEAATVPLAAMTAAVGLFCRLGVPEPWVKIGEGREKIKGGIVIYGAATAVGAFAIKLLSKADVHPIIAVAGKGMKFVETLIDRSKGDTIVDYREGDEKLVEAVQAAVPHERTLKYAFDAVSEHSSTANICKVLDAHDGYLTTVLPVENVVQGVHLDRTQVSSVHQRDREFGYAWFRLFSMGLKEGWLTGHPYEVVPGGLKGVQHALANLVGGKASAVKYVFRIEETDGLGKA